MKTKTRNKEASKKLTAAFSRLGKASAKAQQAMLAFCEVSRLMQAKAEVDTKYFERYRNRYACKN